MDNAKLKKLTEKEIKIEAAKRKAAKAEFVSLSLAGKDFLRSTTSEGLTPFAPKTLFTIGSNEPVQRAFQLMIEHKITSLPVRDTKRGRFTKFVDMLDILVYILGRVEKAEEQWVLWCNDSGTDDGELGDILAKDAATVADVAGTSSRNQFEPVSEATSMHNIFENVVNRGHHRIPALTPLSVVDVDGNLITVFSQSMLAKVLHEKRGELSAERLGASLKSLGVGFVEVESIGVERRALDAFRQIREKNVSALAVVSDEGKLVGTVSATDLKIIGFNGHLVDALFLPLDKYHDIKHKDSPAFPVTASPETPLGEVLERLVTAKVHRLFVIDSDERPVGVVTAMDVFRALLA